MLAKAGHCGNHHSFYYLYEYERLPSDDTVCALGYMFTCK